MLLGALGLVACASARAETVPAAGIAAACPTATTVAIRLGAQTFAIPREMLVSATGARIAAGDRDLGCAGRTIEAERVEVHGLSSRTPILLSPAVSDEVAQKTIAYLQALRAGKTCTGEGRLTCTAKETHNGQEIPFRYVFSPDPTQVTKDGAPANARCMVTQAKPFCLVDMNDPRGFHITMQYPLEGFRPQQVMSLSDAVQTKLAPITGGRTGPVTVPGPISAQDPVQFASNPACGDVVTLEIGGRTLAIARTALLGTSGGAATGASGCEGAPRSVRQAFVRQDGIAGLLEISAATTPDRGRQQAFFADLKSRSQCQPGPNYIACAWTDPQTGGAVTSYLADGSGQPPMIECRAPTMGSAPLCVMTAYANGLVAKLMIAKPQDGASMTKAQLALGMTLVGFTAKR
jgi:hypothetical protein